MFLSMTDTENDLLFYSNYIYSVKNVNTLEEKQRAQGTFVFQI